MLPRAWAAAGLLAGVTVGVALIAMVALLPDPRLAPAPTATLAPSATPSTTVPAATAVPGAPASASASAPNASGSAAALMHIGERAPVLALQLAAGGFTDLAERRGKPVWVVFVTTSCAPCSSQVPLLNDFGERYGGDGLVILAVDVREDAGTVSGFVRRSGAAFPFLLDLDGSAARDWTVAAYPSHFWIDATGVIRDAAQGPATAELMAHGLAQILPGVAVTP